MKNTASKFLALCFAVTLLVGAVVPAASSTEHPASPAIRVAPPAPVFTDQQRHEELATRRARVAQAVGPKGTLILFSAEPRVYTNDVQYYYRQENNLYYLTNLKQKGITLVITPGNSVLPEILFLRKRNAFAEQWNGRMYSVEEASRVSGIKEIWDASELGPFLRALKNKQPYQPKPESVLMSARSGERSGTSGFEPLIEAAGKNEADLYLLAAAQPEGQEYRQEFRAAAEWGQGTGFRVQNASPIFANLRLRKSPMEITLMQHAIDITNEALQRAWVVAGSAKWEYEVDAEVIYTFKLRNADHWGYPPIVGCGPNATILHYIESQSPLKPGDLLLMDVGAEYEHYTADVTRTFPVNGKFTSAQAEIYQIVYDAQEAAAKATRPGATISDVDRAATEVIKDGLLRLGLITDKASSQHRLWFMHGTSHWLGMNVHDVGNYGVKLEPGMTFTNEPGIYIGPEALDNLPKSPENEKFIAAIRPAFEKYKGIGVRIEDDMLVTENGVKWMTAALPRKASEIEAFIAKARPSR
ncbi:MAG TPA: aminopeptidase P N-terminal domain-containing protein [Pyrinomonadaceae bacterium]|nr:aminopeptidase P N-terminal domain-containing protein [Pyrinomonadaceae bacterium]